MNEDLHQRLEHLRVLLDKGTITQEEYEAYRQKLLDTYLGAGSSHAAGQPHTGDPFATPQGDSYRPRRSTRLSDLRPDLEIGPKDHRFRLVRRIGGGAMGEVWQAHDVEEEKLEGGERYKALKVVNPLLQDLPRALEALKREAARASDLTHPNIINVRGWRQGEDGWLFVVMDYLQGRDLDQLLLEEGKPGLSWERALQLLKSIAAGLDYAHGHHIIHRDLKPGNVFITGDGEVKLLDFGLAYRLHRSSSMIHVQGPALAARPNTCRRRHLWLGSRIRSRTSMPWPALPTRC